MAGAGGRSLYTLGFELEIGDLSGSLFDPPFHCPSKPRTTDMRRSKGMLREAHAQVPAQIPKCKTDEPSTLTVIRSINCH